MILSEIISLDRTECAVDCQSKKRIFEVISEIAVKHNPELDQGLVLASLVNREKMGSTGIGNGISWQMIQIEHDVLGKPFVTLLAEAQNFVDKNAISAWHISISDEQNYATATAIIEC